MAEQRAFGNTDKSPAEGGTQVRESTQEAGTQSRDRNQEGARHGEETASASSQQGREQVAAVENSLEDAIRAKPLQSTLMAAGLGMFLTLLWKKEETASDYSRQGRQQAEDYSRQGRQQVAAVENTLEDAMRTKPLQSLLIAAGCGMVLTLLLKR